MANDGRKIPKRSAQSELRRSNEDTLRTHIANRLQEGIETAKKEFERCQASFTHHDQEDLEKSIVFDFAINNNLWIEDLYTLGKPTLVGGIENTLALDDATGFLYKSNNLYNVQFLISNLLEQMRLHNELFPETKYDLVGFTGFDNGRNRTPYIEVIFKQLYIDNTVQASTEEIIYFMESLGFKKVSETNFTNDKYIVADLFPRNVLKDDYGFIYVVDNIITKHVKL